MGLLDRGDYDAFFEEKPIQDAILRFATRRNPWDAEDLAGEVTLKLYQKLESDSVDYHRYGGDGFWGFMLVTIYNIARGLARKQYAQKKYRPNSSREPLFDDIGRPAERNRSMSEPEERVDRILIREFFDSLPYPDRIVLRLYWFEEHKYTEIAEHFATVRDPHRQFRDEYNWQWARRIVHKNAGKIRLLLGISSRELEEWKNKT